MDIPSIPDNFYKILVTVGIAIVVYAYHDFKQTNDLYDKNVSRLEANMDVIIQRRNETAMMLERVKESSELIALRLNIKNPLHITDSIIIFDRVLKGGERAEQLNDSLWKLYTDYKKLRETVTYQERLLIERRKALDHQLNMLNEAGEERNNITVLGIFLIGVGFLGLFVQQIYSNQLIKAQLREKGRYYKFCQSCGRKFSLMRTKGTSETGNLVNGFCHTCYQNGAFVNPNLTQEQVLKDAVTTLSKGSFLQILWLKFRIAHLERWQKDEYFD